MKLWRTNGEGRKLSLNEETFFFLCKQYQRIAYAKKKKNPSLDQTTIDVSNAESYDLFRQHFAAFGMVL